MATTNALHQKAQNDQFLRRLGRLGTVGDPTSSRHGPGLRLVRSEAPAPTLEPVTAFTRTVDQHGRLKLTGTSVPSNWFDWQPGSLTVDVVEGWLLIRQPSDVASTRPGRFGCDATLSAGKGGMERITLRPAHLEQVGLPDDRQLLVSVFKNPDVLVAVSPLRIFEAIPDNVGRVLNPAV